MARSAELILGFSEKVAADRSRGSLRVLQARDIDADGEVRWHQLDCCEAKHGSERARLRRDDVLLTMRSAEPRATLITNPPADVVAGATFAIVRCRADLLDPHYLHWWLGAERTRERLRGLLRGSAMPFLGLGDLANLQIPLPPLPSQRGIARVHALRSRIRELAARQDRALGHLLEAAATGSPSS